MNKFNSRENAEKLTWFVYHGCPETLSVTDEIEKTLNEAYLAGRREQAEMDAMICDKHIKEEGKKACDDGVPLEARIWAEGSEEAGCYLREKIREVAEKIGSEEK